MVAHASTLLSGGCPGIGRRNDSAPAPLGCAAEASPEPRPELEPGCCGMRQRLWATRSRRRRRSTRLPSPASQSPTSRSRDSVVARRTRCQVSALSTSRGPSRSATTVIQPRTADISPNSSWNRSTACGNSAAGDEKATPSWVSSPSREMPYVPGAQSSSLISATLRPLMTACAIVPEL
ncbi:hypothetical protein ACFPRL_15360 [Pseudoclavibacter helvolus]